MAKSRSLTREAVFKLISEERDFQDKKHPNSGANEVGSHLALIETYSRKALDAWTDGKGDAGGLDVIRKIAGLCVRAMEQHGAMPRADADELAYLRGEKKR